MSLFAFLSCHDDNLGDFFDMPSVPSIKIYGVAPATWKAARRALATAGISDVRKLSDAAIGRRMIELFLLHAEIIERRGLCPVTLEPIQGDTADGQ